MFMLRRLTYAVGTLPFSFLMHIFETLVAPVVLYGAEIWGPWSRPEVDVTERKFIKACLKLPSCTANAGLSLEAGRFLSLYWKARIRTISYWAKVRVLPDERLVKLAYRKQRELADLGIDCWGKRVQELLEIGDMEHLWLSEVYIPPGEIKKKALAAFTNQAHGETLVEAHTKESLKQYLERRSGSRPVLHLRAQPRRYVLAVRLSVPLFLAFATERGERIKLCRLCKNKIPQCSWAHILAECREVAHYTRSIRLRQ
jgi:hypothetical protein